MCTINPQPTCLVDVYKTNDVQYETSKYIDVLDEILSDPDVHLNLVKKAFVIHMFEEPKFRLPDLIETINQMILSDAVFEKPSLTHAVSFRAVAIESIWDASPNELLQYIHTVTPWACWK